jgi:membrane fusion protein (multidrug efflux system)
MPEPPDPNHNPAALQDDVRFLALEHVRLQNEIDQLREEHRRLVEEGKQAKNGKPVEEKRGEGQESGGDKQPKDQEQGDKKEEKEDKKEEKEQPKAPLKQRVSEWTHAHPLGLLLIIAALLVLAIAGYFFWNYLQSFVSTDDAEIDGHIHQLSSRIAGTVVAVYVENNRSVQHGQTLVDLDPRDYETALTQAQANLAQALAALEAQAPNVPITQTTETTSVSTARHEVANAEAALQAARQSHESALADLRQAEANADNATAEERRYRDLAEKQEVSREQYDQRATQARAQQAQVSSRRASADAAEKAVEQRQAALAEARDHYLEAQSNQPRQVAVQRATVATRKASVEAAKAQVAQAGLNLSYCKILAPVSGIVGDKTVEVGQQVAPGQELLAITGTDDLWVTANFKETQIVNMHPGQRVRMHVDALEQDFDGYVKNMPGATGAQYSLLPPENATGNYVKVVQRLPVRIRFKPGQNGFERLRPGMSVEPKVWVK